MQKDASSSAQIADQMLQLDQLENITRKKVLQILCREGQQLKIAQSRPEQRFRFYIDPHSKRVFIWNVIFIIVFYLFELHISLSLAFGPRFLRAIDVGTFFLPIYILVLIFLLIDLALSFFKGYYAFGKGKVIDDGWSVVKNYLKTQFYIDFIVISVYSIPLFHEDFALNFMQLIPAALIWIKKFKYQRQGQTTLQYKQAIRSLFTLTILSSDVLMIANYGACIFIGMDALLYDKSYYGTGENSPWYWLTANTSYPYSLIYGPWYYEYIYGQQFAMGTLSTLAPGPFGKNPYEIFYSILVMIFFVLLASYVSEVVIQIIYTYTQRRIFHEDNIISFENFMQLKDVSRDIRKRIYNFFQLVWEVELKLENKEQGQMIAKLPLYLRQELLRQIGFASHLRFLQFLPQEESLKRLLSLKIKRSTADAKTCIFQSYRESITPQRNIYFIKEGVGKFYLKNSSNEEGIRTPQTILNMTNIVRVLGVYEFVTGQDYAVCCQSIDLCVIQTLSWNDFTQILAQLHLEEYFFELQHRVLNEKQYGLIFKTCFICLECHIQSQCPHLYSRFRFRNEFQSAESLQTNKRYKHKRRNIKSKKSLTFEAHYPFSSKTLIHFFQDAFKIDQFILDINKFENLIEIQTLADYQHYFPKHNLHQAN